MAAHVEGAAWRRRQRRMRSWWRHEQQSIAAVLATVSHRSYPKVDTANAVLRGQTIGTSTRAGDAEYYELSSDDGRPAGGTRPRSLLDPRPQVKVEQHGGIGCELVLALDAPMLHIRDEDLALKAFLEQVSIQEIAEVQVPSSSVFFFL